VAEPAGSAGLAAEPDVSALAVLVEPRLVPNAGFEESGAAPIRWTADSSASVVGAPVRSGTRALRTDDDSATVGRSVRSQTLAVRPGERLTASVWAQRISGLSGSLYLEFWRVNGTRVEAAVRSRDIANVAGWQSIAVTGTTPDDAISATVLIYNKQTTMGTTVWDDVSVQSEPPVSRQIPNAGFEELREGTAPTEWQASAGATLVTSPVYGGRRALRTSDSAGSSVTVLSRSVPVFPPEELRVTAQAQVMSGHSGTLYLEYRRADGSSQSSWKSFADVAAVAGWQTVSVAMAAPAEAVSATIRIYSKVDPAGTTVWDDVRLRSSREVGYSAALGTGSVLFVGDQRVESTAGVTRVVHPGVKTGDPAIPGNLAGVVLAGGSWDKNPRINGTVLAGADGRYRMWYTAADQTRNPPCSYCTGYAESTDGIRWERPVQGSIFPNGSGGVVENPRHDPSDPASPRYYMLYGGLRSYYAASSRDGKAWAPLNGGQPIIIGWDVGNVSYDPNRALFIAMTKQWAQTAPFGPRTVSVSTSQDFVSWSAPQLAMSADTRDHDMVVAKNPNDPSVLSEIYGMPAIRYGEQYLGLPWMFDITHCPTPLGDPGPDIGRQHIQLAASQDLLTWSRPNRDDIITPGAPDSWDWGYHLTGTTMLTVGNQFRLYYSAFAGEHSCDASKVDAGICSVPLGSARVGLVTWPKDRFVSFRAGSAVGTVTTRLLAPTGRRLVVNANSSAGELRVEVLTADGVPVPGYTLDDAAPISADTLGMPVRWAASDRLPNIGGPIRLRFSLSRGDLYSYTID
jgi:hypothetical protein